MLENTDVVIGPATDGGYYLLGLKYFYKEFFENIPWSTEYVLADTIRTAEKLNLKYSLLPELSDIDTEENFNAMNKIKL